MYLPHLVFFSLFPLILYNCPQNIKELGKKNFLIFFLLFFYKMRNERILENLFHKVGKTNTNTILKTNPFLKNLPELNPFY